MSDDVILPGTGESIAADIIGSVFYQRVKLTIGADGVNNGDISASNPIPVKAPNISVSTPISGVITIATAGTAVQGTDIALGNGVFIKALSGNTGKVYVGNDGAGDVTSANGFELAQGDLILLQVANLNNLWFDSATNGDKICWLKV
jgi:hypothetical protein